MNDHNRRVGQALRIARKGSGFSLKGVEETTKGEFKASVVGAYERGERAISVARLMDLSAVYETPAVNILEWAAHD